MKCYITLGSTPCGEKCAQVGSDDYNARSYRECFVYLHQLERLFPSGVFGIKAFPHDYGTCYEVVTYYDTENESEVNMAFNIDGNLPEHWDELAEDESGL